MILGAATLLLWGVHMAQPGVMRIYGLQIRKFLPRAFNHKLLGLAIGAGAATILQSSIAVSIFTANLAAAGRWGSMVGLAGDRIAAVPLDDVAGKIRGCDLELYEEVAQVFFS